MGGDRSGAHRPFSRAIAQWAHTGTTEEGGKPPEVAEAELVESICQRYHKLPSEVLAEPAPYLLRHVWIINQLETAKAGSS